MLERLFRRAIRSEVASNALNQDCKVTGKQGCSVQKPMRLLAHESKEKGLRALVCLEWDWWSGRRRQLQVGGGSSCRQRGRWSQEAKEWLGWQLWSRAWVFLSVELNFCRRIYSELHLFAKPFPNIESKTLLPSARFEGRDLVILAARILGIMWMVLLRNLPE